MDSLIFLFLKLTITIYIFCLQNSTLCIKLPKGTLCNGIEFRIFLQAPLPQETCVPHFKCLGHKFYSKYRVEKPNFAIYALRLESYSKPKKFKGAVFFSPKI